MALHEGYSHGACQKGNEQSNLAHPSCLKPIQGRDRQEQNGQVSQDVGNVGVPPHLDLVHAFGAGYG